MASSYLLLLNLSITLAFSYGYLNSYSGKALPQLKKIRTSRSSLSMIELEGTNLYVAAFVMTMIPSLAFVKFVGDQADKTRGSLSTTVCRYFFNFKHDDRNYYCFSKKKNLRRQ